MSTDFRGRAIKKGRFIWV